MTAVFQGKSFPRSVSHSMSLCLFIQQSQSFAIMLKFLIHLEVSFVQERESLFADYMILYIKGPEDSIRKCLDLIKLIKLLDLQSSRI